MLTPSAISARGARAALREERRPRSAARVARTVETDAAAGARDLFVARAGEAQRELVRALAAVDEMRVAVDEAGRDECAAAVVAGHGGIGWREARVGADPANAALRDDDRRLNAGLKGNAGRGLGREAQAGPHAVGGFELGECIHDRLRAFASVCASLNAHALTLALSHERERGPEGPVGLAPSPARGRGLG